MSEFRFESQGFDEFSRMLKDLSKASQRGVFRKAFRTAIANLEPKLKGTSAWSDRTGDLRRSITSKIGVRRGAVKADIKGNYYGRFLEFGWVPGKRPGTRAGRAERIRSALKFVPPRAWIRPVFTAEKDRIVQQILGDMQAEIARVMKRHLRKRAKG